MKSDAAATGCHRDERRVKERTKETKSACE